MDTSNKEILSPLHRDPGCLCGLVDGDRNHSETGWADIAGHGSTGVSSCAEICELVT
jgi:hypothetical protein